MEARALVCFALLALTSGTQIGQLSSNKVIQLLSNYDRLVRPPTPEGSPTEVICDVYINSLDSINVNDMDYTIDIYMRQSWLDTRLAFKHLFPNDSVLTLDTRLFDKIWVPDLFFPNEKRAQGHSITVPNRLIRISSDGRVLFSARYSLVLVCHMSLRSFPFDNQECNLLLESYGYTLEEMKFEWRSDKDAVQINPHIQFPQFDLVDKNVTYCQKSYITGNFTCLRAVFHLHRHFGYYMIQNYIPSGLIVVLSWVSFWISTDAVPARITLGVLTVLTMTTQCVGIWMSLPMVSYIKAIDIWMSTCVMSVFFAMLEFAVVNTMSRKEARDMAKMRPTADNDDKHIEQQVKDMIEFHTFDTEPQNCSTARFIDKASRLMFPLFFVVFNVVYWCYFLTQ